MLTADFTIKRSDVGKTISGQFQDANGDPINCFGATAPKFFLREYGGLNIVIIDGAAFIFSDATNGKFAYTFTSNDLNAMQPNPRGDAFFKGEFRTTLQGGVVMTTPTDPIRPFLIIKFEHDLSD